MYFLPQKLPFATYLEEQEQLKAEFHQAVGEGDGVEEDKDLLTLRKKNKEEMSDKNTSRFCVCDYV